MGEWENVLSDVHLKDECVREMRSWTLLAKCRPSLSSKANQVLFIQNNLITNALSSFPNISYSEVQATESCLWVHINDTPPPPLLARAKHEETCIWRRGESMQCNYNIYVNYLNVQLVYYFTFLINNTIFGQRKFLYLHIPENNKSLIELFYWTLS